MAKKNAREEPPKPQVTENEQMSDIVFILDKMELILEAVSQIGQDGKFNTVAADRQNRNSFLKIDRYADAFENFIKNFWSQLKDPTRFGILSVKEDRLDDPAVQQAIEDIAAGKKTKVVEEFLKQYEIVPRNKENQSINQKNQEEMAKKNETQQQRVAIAGIVAMKPKCIVLDEPTAMLDPLGRKDVLNVLHELNRQENVTVILITHYMEEVIDIDKLYVMDDGKLVMSGTPREIFSQVEKLKELRLDVPHVTELAYELQKEGVPLKNGILTSEEFTEELIRVRNEGFNVNNSR